MKQRMCGGLWCTSPDARFQGKCTVILMQLISCLCVLKQEELDFMFDVEAESATSRHASASSSAGEW